MCFRCAGRWRARFVVLIALWWLCQAADAGEAATGGDPEIEALRAELAVLRQGYEARIAALEARLDSVQAATGGNSPLMSASGAGTAGVTNNRDFNPAIGVIFQGQAWKSQIDPDDQVIPGFPVGGEAGPLPRGLALGETEIDMSANVDDLFTAWLTIPLVIEDGETSVEIEEAWIETLGLPLGMSMRFGRFYSGIGYLNGRHSHTWDFVDQPLAYQVFLGNQYLDDGVQLRWLAPTDLYLEVGGELLRGDRYPAGGAANDGIASRSVFTKVGGDVGPSHSWQAGVSYLHSRSRDRVSGPEDAELVFSGDSDLFVAELLWKFAPNGNWRQRNLVVQGEFLWRDEDGRYLLPDGSTAAIDQGQRGWYAQMVYQPIPQWRVGARVDRLSSDDPGALFVGTALDPVGDDPERYTVMLDWSHSEFSRLRLQYARDLSAPKANDQWGLQYIYSIGAHGAHAF